MPTLYRIFCSLAEGLLKCVIVLLISTPSTFAAENDADSLAKALLQRAGVQATVCEMPHVGDGELAAALASLGVAQVHCLAANLDKAERARQPAERLGLLGSQVIVESGDPFSLPLGDWVADLYLVSDATDESLIQFSAAEAGRVLSPYRGVALVGNPVGAKAGLSKEALHDWAQGIGGMITISEDDGGLWAVVKMPELKGGDDWGHFYHGPDMNPVSKDTAFIGENYQLQAFDYPLRGHRNFTMVASAGRFFVANSTLYSGLMGTWSQMPIELVARSIYNAKVLWRRPLAFRFGDMGSLMVATPNRFFLKDGADVLVLNPETGEEISRINATLEPEQVIWLVHEDGVLLTLIGPEAYSPLVDIKGGFSPKNNEELYKGWEGANEGQVLIAWDVLSNRELWRFKGERIVKSKLVVSHGGVFLHVNGGDALALDLKSGKQLWKSPAPLPEPILTERSKKSTSLFNHYRGEPWAVANAEAYVLCDPVHFQYQAFSLADGHELWNIALDPNVRWGTPKYPYILEDIIYAGVPRALLSGAIIERSKNPLSNVKISPASSCGHFTLMESGHIVGNGLIEINSGNQIAPSLAKAPCGTGFFVANGVELMYPNTCTCGVGWHGLMTMKPSSPKGKKIAATPRLEHGAAPSVKSVESDASDWTSYRSDNTRKGSSSAVIPKDGGIRWTYKPPYPASGKGVANLPAYMERNKFSTQWISVATSLWFGTSDGEVVCMDSIKGSKQWSYWTAGSINVAPVWSKGRVYVGSFDGYVYCLNGNTGQLYWRYRVAPEDRRINLFGKLSSSWPVQSILVHEGMIFISGGLVGELDGSVICSLDAKTGEEIWTKVMKNRVDNYDNGALKNNAPAAGGQMAWYGDRLWWLSLDMGPVVIDPATGDWTFALPRSYFGNRGDRFVGVDAGISGTWRMVSGKDIGIMPGGWVAVGHEIMSGACNPKYSQVMFRSDSEGIDSDAPEFPKLLSVNNGKRGFYYNREIPVWDSQEVLTRGSPTDGALPTLYRGFSDALNSIEGRKREEYKKKPAAGAVHLVKPISLSLSENQQHAVLPDLVAKSVIDGDSIYGAMLMAKNAVVMILNGRSNRAQSYRMVNSGRWRVVAISRTDRSILYDVSLPTAPAPSGMSLTRAGDVLVPLVDGRVVCIGANPISESLSASTVSETKPGLWLKRYFIDIPRDQYDYWSEEDLAVRQPIQSLVVPDQNVNGDKTEKGDQRLDVFSGYLAVPESGIYKFNAKTGAAGSVTIEILDDTERFIDFKGTGHQWGSFFEVNLEKGKHHVRMTVVQGYDGVGLTLKWEGPGVKNEEVPPEAFSYSPGSHL